ncbi:MAG: hypothetical protein EZS28_009683 [Streblomastix strix]|uniref:Uncharacterized protein n=1 Tax=Streblomastix strix TaxID=222440 RepID=A0A5J4WIJ6_9EUKA|nr:MAG: hypothetical protein EZS28_009683 [Streblomastix strix]
MRYWVIVGLHAEPLTESELKNFIWDKKPVTMSIKNYIITELKANVAGYKAIDSYVTDFCLLFPKDARATICIQNLCNQNMQITTCGRNFPDMPMNTLDQQFFQLQLNASNIDLIFEATIEFEDALTTPRNTAT